MLTAQNTTDLYELYAAVRGKVPAEDYPIIIDAITKFGTGMYNSGADMATRTYGTMRPSPMTQADILHEVHVMD